MPFLRLYPAFAAGYLLSYFYRNVNAVISPELTRELSLSPGALGLLTAVYFVAFAGDADSRGHAARPLRPAPRRACAAAALPPQARSLFALADSEGGLLAARALIGMGVAICLMAPLKAIATWYPKERQASLGGWMMVAGSAGALVATAPLEFALRFVSWRVIFVALAVTTCAAALLIGWLVPDTPAASRTVGLRAQWAGVRSVFAHPRFWWIAPLAALGIGSFMAVQGLWAVPWLIEVNGFDRAVAAQHLLVMGVTMLVGYVALGLGLDASRAPRDASAASLRRRLRVERAGAGGNYCPASGNLALVGALWPWRDRQRPRVHRAERWLCDRADRSRQHRAQSAHVHRQLRRAMGDRHRRRSLRGAGSGSSLPAASSSRSRSRSALYALGYALVRLGLAAARRARARGGGLKGATVAGELEALLREASECVAARDRNGAIAAYRKALEIAPGTRRAPSQPRRDAGGEASRRRGAQGVRGGRAAASRMAGAVARRRAHAVRARALQGSRRRVRGGGGARAGATRRELQRRESADPHEALESRGAASRPRARARARERGGLVRASHAALALVALRGGGRGLRALRGGGGAVGASRGRGARDADARRRRRARSGGARAGARWPYAEGDAELVAELLALLQYVDVPQERLFSIYRTYDRLQQARQRGMAPLARPRADGDPVWRIGYLSADFRDHVMGKLLLPVIAAHDRSPLRSSRLCARATRELRCRYRAMEGGGRRVRQRRGARRSRRGRGHRGRRSRSSRRPDGPFVVRAARDPAQQARADRRHASRLPRRGRSVAGRLQDHRPLRRHRRRRRAGSSKRCCPIDTCVLPLRRVAPAPDAAMTRPQLGLPEEAIVFGAFVGVLKLSQRCVGVWRRILDAVPDSVLAFSPRRDEDRRAIERARDGSRHRRLAARLHALSARRRRVQPGALRAHRHRARHDALHRRRHDGRRARRRRSRRHASRRPPRRAHGLQHPHASRPHADDCADRRRLRRARGAPRAGSRDFATTCALPSRARCAIPQRPIPFVTRARSRTAYERALDGGRSRRRSACDAARGDRRRRARTTPPRTLRRCDRCLSARASAGAGQCRAFVHNLGVALAATDESTRPAPRSPTAVALAPAVRRVLARARPSRVRARPAGAPPKRRSPPPRGSRPDPSRRSTTWAIARHERWRFPEAVPPLVAARALAPANEQVWYQLYNTRLALGDREGALADFLAFERHAAPTPVFLRAALESGAHAGGADARGTVRAGRCSRSTYRRRRRRSARRDS